MAYNQAIKSSLSDANGVATSVLNIKNLWLTDLGNFSKLNQVLH